MGTGKGGGGSFLSEKQAKRKDGILTRLKRRKKEGRVGVDFSTKECPKRGKGSLMEGEREKSCATVISS